MWSNMFLVFKYSKVGLLKVLSQLELSKIFIKTFRILQLPVKYKGKFSPKMKLSFGPAFPSFIDVLNEPAMLELTEKINIEKFLKESNKLLPNDIKITKAYLIEEKVNLDKSVNYFIYKLKLNKIPNFKKVKFKLQRTKIFVNKTNASVIMEKSFKFTRFKEIAEFFEQRNIKIIEATRSDVILDFEL